MIKTKLVSSLEKAFVDDKIENFEPISRISVLRGERLSCQLLHTQTAENFVWMFYAPLSFSGSLAEYATARDVCNLPVTHPVNLPDLYDDNYLRTTPGIYPDLLRPLHQNGCAVIACGVLSSIWIEVDIPEDLSAGIHTLTVSLDAQKHKQGVISHTLEVEVIDAVLPEQTLKNTEWFHCDSLATYYNVRVWSKRHWEIIENYMRVAVKNGQNMIITPVFTLPLDTAPGGERLTHQLVGVTKTGDEYSFDFKLLDKWIRLCNKVGFKYFEISHFFTQWGAAHAPKVMATVDGEYKRIFGWDTDAHGEEYRVFLRSFLAAFLAHMKKRGDDKRCFFHISDEPSIDHIESYAASKAVVADLLEGYVIMDAMSKYDFLERGLVDVAIPSNDHIKPFLEHNVEGLWTYYCCAQSVDVSNRLIAMPSYRNRSIGMQMFKYNIVGFLQWGYNFYQSFHSNDTINPAYDLSGDAWVPAGDVCSVYPAQNGEALESLRLIVFNEALQDMRAMQLLESFMPHDKIVSEIEAAFGKTVKFDVCATSAKEILAVREKVNELIKKAIKA